jgi:hypothetical protein
MAGRGPAPKQREQRRNRAQKTAGDWVQLPSEGYQGPIPSLAGLELSNSTHEWWKTIWRSPMASQWNQGDVPALKELAMLRELLLDGKVSVAAEVRLRSDSFGLTPAGRQQRRWMITEEDQERAGVKKSKEASLRRLRAVDPLLNK